MYVTADFVDILNILAANRSATIRCPEGLGDVNKSPENWIT